MPNYPFWRLTNPDKTKERGLTWQQMQLIMTALDKLADEASDLDLRKDAANLSLSFVWLMIGYPTPPNDADYGECADF